MSHHGHRFHDRSSVHRMMRVLICLAVIGAAAAASRSAIADEPPKDTVVSPEAAASARDAFREGAKAIDRAEWDTAIGFFEKSRALSPHALTTYNIGVCQRYIGRFTQARQTLEDALAYAKDHGGMAPAFIEQADVYIHEIEGKLARVVVTVSPKTTKLAIDGRPLVPSKGRSGAFVAGLAPAGSATSAPDGRFEILVDPRPATVFTFSLEGHDTIDQRLDLKQSAKEELTLSMTEQPARIRIAANVKGAIVRVDNVDVGIAPVSISRPPGARRVTVISEGYVPYETKLDLKAGQDLPIDALLEQERVPLTKKWWFWTGSAVLLTGVGVLTYFLVRPAPERPREDPGGLGWIAEVK